MLFSCLKQLNGFPTYGINPNWPLRPASPFMMGPLASFPDPPLIFPSHPGSSHAEPPGHTSNFGSRSHGFILPRLCPHLEFLLVHPSPPHSPGELFILQI